MTEDAVTGDAANTAKADARKAAFARRKAAFEADRDQGFPAVAAATEALCALIAQSGPGPVSGYMPIRSEVSPLPAMHALAPAREIGVPVIQGRGQALVFHRWSPESPMVEGPFGALIPADPVVVVPRILIVPMVAFDMTGARLGYGGGFYDRTLANLRADGSVTAIGFAYGAQAAEALPRDATDQRLDALVTEAGVTRF